MLKLLIAGRTDFTEEDLKKIQSMGYSITVLEREDEAIIPSPELYNVVICNWLFTKHNISDFINLKAVQLLSAGLDRIPMDYADKHNICVRNARGIYSIPIAEFTVMAVLDEYKHSEFFYENQKMHKWCKRRDLDELSDKTVCIFGTGSVGTEIAKRFSAFVDKVIGIDLYQDNRPYFTKIIDISNMHDAVQISDIIIITLPLTEKTYHMFDLKTLNKMKDGAVLINIARGALIDEASLRCAIEGGKLRAVILDVFEEEPLDKDYWAWESERVRIIPHNSFESSKNKERIKEKIMKNLAEWYPEISLGGGQ